MKWSISGRKWVAPLIAVAALSVGGGAFAATQSSTMLNGQLFGNIPNVTVRGVAAGKAPWIVEGHVALTKTDLTVTGKWLIIPKTGFMVNGQAIPKALAGTTAGVKSIVAEITFANSPAIVTAPVTLSTQGDFKISATVKMPAGAAQPVVLIGPAAKGKMVAWFASSNFLMDYGQYKAGAMGKSSTKSSGW